MSLHSIASQALFLFLFSIITACSATAQQENSRNAGVDMARDCVILLHGLGRTSASMRSMADALGRENFLVVNQDYPSRELNIEVLALDSIPKALTQCRQRGGRRIHFVTHSMGGILLRYYLSVREISGLGHTVMLSPPNHGSEVVDLLKDNVLYEWMNGPAGQQLGTDADSLPLRLDGVDYSVGVIIGNQPAFYDGYFSDLIPGPDDGKVSVESAKLPGMKDFLVVPCDHTFIMDDAEVIRQTIHFLKFGRFAEAEARRPPE